MPILWNEALASIGSIIFINLVLSGDNALVIGAVVSTIPTKRRQSALVLGGGIAIVLRILFTAFAALLLKIPFLRFFGGLLVLLIAIRLLMEQQTEKDAQETVPLAVGEKKPPLSLGQRLAQRGLHLFKGQLSTEGTLFFNALVSIVIADITMSLDNIISVAALAKGNLLFLTLGLALSILLLILGSAIVATLMQRFPALLFVAYLVLIWVSVNLIWDDLASVAFIHYQLEYEIALYTLIFVIMLGVALFLWQKNRRSADYATRHGPKV